MSKTVEHALDALRSLGTPEQLRDASRKGLAPANRPKVNSHIHLPPNFSAFETVSQAVDLADAQDVRVVGVSNYYDFRVYADFVAAAADKGIFPLFGLEIIALLDDLVAAGTKINDPGNPGKMYICGKGITKFATLSAEADRLLGVIRESDTTRMRAMAARLREVFAERGLPVDLTEADCIARVVERHGSREDAVTLQERHLAQCFQEALFARTNPADRLAVLAQILGAESKAGSPDDTVTIQGEIRSALMKAGKVAFVDESFVNFDEAIRLILELGGIPCYPTLADGKVPICEFEAPVDGLIDRLRERGITMAEFIPLRNQPDVLREYVLAMRQAGLVVVGGTEHNTLDLAPIEPTCVGGAAVPDDVRDVFWEGACVVAAHQFLTLHGECGFVDAAGRPNANYPDTDSRIAAFASLGATVIETCFRAGRG